MYLDEDVMDQVADILEGANRKNATEAELRQALSDALAVIAEAQEEEETEEEDEGEDEDGEEEEEEEDPAEIEA